jgi:hypothetical protein
LFCKTAHFDEAGLQTFEFSFKVSLHGSQFKIENEKLKISCHVFVACLFFFYF